MNKCIQKTEIPNPERRSQRNRLKQIYTHYVPTDDVKNIYARNWGDILLTDKLWTVPLGTIW